MKLVTCSGELQHRFQTKEIPFVVSMEQALIKAANKVDFQSELKKKLVSHASKMI